MNNKDIQLSKSLSWLLRHGAVREGFKLSPEGYLDVNKILQHKTFRGKYSTLDIERVVNNNDKQRFKLRQNPTTHCLEIKANQGHTITEVSDADLTPITEPKYNTVIHGTYLKCWPQIKNEGISHMKRKHIHLAKGTLEDASVISGIRQDAEVHIYIDLEGALADNVKFYESENGVILTSGNEKGYLEPKYFAKAVNILTVSCNSRFISIHYKQLQSSCMKFVRLFGTDYNLYMKNPTSGTGWNVDTDIGTVLQLITIPNPGALTGSSLLAFVLVIQAVIFAAYEIFHST